MGIVNTGINDGYNSIQTNNSVGFIVPLSPNYASPGELSGTTSAASTTHQVDTPNGAVAVSSYGGAMSVMLSKPGLHKVEIVEAETPGSLPFDLTNTVPVPTTTLAIITVRVE